MGIVIRILFAAALVFLLLLLAGWIALFFVLREFWRIEDDQIN